MFPTLTRPHVVHWAAQPMVTEVCLFLYNFLKPLNGGHIAEYRLDYLFGF